MEIQSTTCFTSENHNYKKSSIFAINIRKNIFIFIMIYFYFLHLLYQSALKFNIYMYKTLLLKNMTTSTFTSTI